MIQTLATNPLAFFISFITLVIAITIHEFSHAFIADRLGDPTPRLQRRLTLNPLAHLDLLGTIMLLFFKFGWGKPVQFDPFNLRKPRRDAAIISIAGPISNIILAIIASVVLKISGETFFLSHSVGVVILQIFLIQLLAINVLLAIFNLIPIHPLDGFKIVAGVLPEHYAKQWNELERYGIIFLIAMLLPLGGSSAIQNIISPPVNFLLQLLLPQMGAV